VVLVDTSVWIDFIAGRGASAVTRLQDLLDRGGAVAITAHILQEVLQGADSERSFREFAAYFGTQRFLHPRHPVATFASAARMYFDCRRAGITLRSSIDCTIAQIAVEHGAALLHNDRDFERIGRVVPRLRFA
jgi:predicted nucleic acid-binding protein